MNWDQAENVIPDLVKMELVKSDERFSKGIQEVLQVNTNQDALIELRRTIGELAKLNKDRKARLKRNAEARKAEKADLEKNKNDPDPTWTPNLKKSR
ncbi:Oidioi.mRNA.OKI2018_I69.chr2.g5733.t1.cds [Oikopleura dioica]|uniref:Oidioi.mRNA.OKI2018_I69.chr2.g5733.t1.cds n=1 Tax=Oikopleura dioica TaxID=34765 RepID=A0ABN7T6V8_OIKDI|nr:Oidioi.mRNA.OKI2018_I69.chr2.g5733.t1.cds [Oikopleura dioica]